MVRHPCRRCELREIKTEHRRPFKQRRSDPFEQEDGASEKDAEQRQMNEQHECLHELLHEDDDQRRNEVRP